MDKYKQLIELAASRKPFQYRQKASIEGSPWNAWETIALPMIREDFLMIANMIYQQETYFEVRLIPVQKTVMMQAWIDSDLEVQSRESRYFFEAISWTKLGEPYEFTYTELQQ